MAEGNKKKKGEVIPALTQTEMENVNTLELESLSLENKANEVWKNNPAFLKIIKKIAYYTSKVGLSLEESCMLVDFDLEKFKEEMTLEPLIGKIITIKQLEYKKDLLYTLSSKARNGDDKLAQWLLASKYPEEYGEKKKGTPGEGTDFMFEAIRFIKKNGSNAPLIDEASGNSTVIKHKSASEGTIEKINEILTGVDTPK
jgi:hypothetical protein